MGEDGAAATGAGAAAGKGRGGRLESGGRAVLVAGGKKSTLPPLFCRTRAVRSIGLPQLHAATMVRRGKARVRKGDGGRRDFPLTYIKTFSSLARSPTAPPPRPVALSMALGHKSRRIGHYRSRLLLWCKLGIARKQRRRARARAAPKTQKSFTENP